MKKILSVALCVVLGLSFSSCSKTDNNILYETFVTTDDNDPYTFETVAELKADIKKEPSQYENKQITVKGSILKTEDRIILSNIRGNSGAKFRAEVIKSPNIAVIMSNDIKDPLLDDGDYVKIIGTVKISDSEIYLDNCNYEMIKSIYE